MPLSYNSFSRRSSLLFELTYNQNLITSLLRLPEQCLLYLALCRCNQQQRIALESKMLSTISMIIWSHGHWSAFTCWEGRWTKGSCVRFGFWDYHAHDGLSLLWGWKGVCPWRFPHNHHRFHKGAWSIPTQILSAMDPYDELRIFVRGRSDPVRRKELERIIMIVEKSATDPRGENQVSRRQSQELRWSVYRYPDKGSPKRLWLATSGLIFWPIMTFLNLELVSGRSDSTQPPIANG